MGKLENRITLITGGASGIGEATAKLFAAEGAQVIIADIDEKNGQRVANEIGVAAAFRKTDVSDPTQVEAMVKFAVEGYGRLDVLFNNAFVTRMGPVGKLSIEDWNTNRHVLLNSTISRARNLRSRKSKGSKFKATDEA